MLLLFRVSIFDGKIEEKRKHGFIPKIFALHGSPYTISSGLRHSSMFIRHPYAASEIFNMSSFVRLSDRQWNKRIGTRT